MAGPPQTPGGAGLVRDTAYRAHRLVVHYAVAIVVLPVAAFGSGGHIADTGTPDPGGAGAAARLALPYPRRAGGAGVAALDQAFIHTSVAVVVLPVAALCSGLVGRRAGEGSGRTGGVGALGALPLLTGDRAGLPLLRILLIHRPVAVVVLAVAAFGHPLVGGRAGEGTADAGGVGSLGALPLLTGDGAGLALLGEPLVHRAVAIVVLAVARLCRRLIGRGALGRSVRAGGEGPLGALALAPRHGTGLALLGPGLVGLAVAVVVLPVADLAPGLDLPGADAPGRVGAGLTAGGADPDAHGPRRTGITGSFGSACALARRVLIDRPVAVVVLPVVAGLLCPLV